MIEKVFTWVKKLLNRNKTDMMDDKSKIAKELAEKQFLNLCNHINDVVEGLVPLYDDVENYFFQDIDYQTIKHLLPPWVMDAGRCPESTCSKVMFEKLYRELDDSVTNRCLHWFDLQSTIGAMQDRLIAIKMYLGDLKKIVPLYASFESKDITGCTRNHGEDADRAYTSINNVFATLNSALDIFGKVMYECQNYDVAKFAQYKGLKSRNDGVLFRGCENKLHLFKTSLSAAGLVFSKPICIETMYSYRDEYIHNGAWDYRCTIYYPMIDDTPAEPFIIAPDINASGNFEKYGGRNKFYSTGEMINVTIMPLVEEIITVIEKSVKVFRDELKKLTIPANKDAATKAYATIMNNYYATIRNDFENRGVDELKNIAPGWLTRI